MEVYRGGGLVFKVFLVKKVKFQFKESDEDDDEEEEDDEDDDE